MRQCFSLCLSSILMVPVLPAAPEEIFREDWAETAWALPMTQPEMDKMASRLDPFFKSKDIPWMQPGYFDGLRSLV